MVSKIASAQMNAVKFGFNQLLWFSIYFIKVIKLISLNLLNN